MFEYKIYIVTDLQGNKQCCVTDEGYTIVMVTGYDKNNEVQYFENKAHNLKSWCDKNGFELEVVELTYKL